MPQVTLLWSLWLRLLQPFAGAFTRPGHRRFVEWITALALNVEEHTVTQSVTAIERMADWRTLERFAEYGRWDAVAVTRNLARLIEQAPGHLWYGYHVLAVDDTKVHRSGAHVPRYLHLPRVHGPMPEPGRHRPGPQLRGPRRGFRNGDIRAIVRDPPEG